MKLVGKVLSAHGLKGEIYVHIFSGELSWLKKLEDFGLGDQSGAQKTFRVEKIKAFKDGILIKPVGVNDRNASDLLVKSLFYIPEEHFISDKGETIFLNEIQDFVLINETEDGHQAELGVIQSFSSNGVQDLLVVYRPNHPTFEVPFVDDFILEIDFDHKKVIMCLPAGLDQLHLKDSE